MMKELTSLILHTSFPNLKKQTSVKPGKIKVHTVTMFFSLCGACKPKQGEHRTRHFPKYYWKNGQHQL